MRSAIVLVGSKDALRWRRAYPGHGSAHPEHHGQAPGPSSADGSVAPAPPARCTKTSRPDPKIRLACSHPRFEMIKVNHQATAVTRGFAANCYFSEGASHGVLVQSGFFCGFTYRQVDSTFVSE